MFWTAACSGELLSWLCLCFLVLPPSTSEHQGTCEAEMTQKECVSIPSVFEVSHMSVRTLGSKRSNVLRMQGGTLRGEYVGAKLLRKPKTVT